MADVSYSITGQVQKGALVQSFQATGITSNIATAGVLSVTLGLGTTTQSITTTSLGALGLAFVRNLGTPSTHAVTFGRVVSNTLHDTLRLKAGEAALLRLASGDYAAKSDAAGTTRMVLTIYED